MSKKTDTTIPAACPKTCQLFDNDLDALLHELSAIIDTQDNSLSWNANELDSLLETLAIDTDKTIEVLDTSGHCPYCGSK